MLKMKDADLAQLRAAIEPLDKQEHRDRYLAGNFRNADACKDKDMRYRWDLLYACGLKIGDGVGSNGDIQLYSYLNDEHIDSALRAIVPPLKGPDLAAAPSAPPAATPRRPRP